MTQRERHTPNDGADATPALTSPAGAGLACVWEELFQAAAPGRQQQLLALAGRHGVLYAHQLPPAGNGSARRPLLPGLLNGHIHDLIPLRPTPVDCGDACLDDAQRDAAARALQTPDLCLIQGYPGSGKSRTTAEIVAGAVARGERVLLLAPTAAAVDCVLERLDSRDGVCAVRSLAADERPESLPPGLRRLVFEERIRSFHEQTLPAAKQAADDAERLLALRRNDDGVWASLEEIAGRLEAAAEERRRLADGMSHVDAEVEADAAAGNGDAAFQKAWSACRAVRDEALARIDARLAELRAEAEKVRVEQKADAEETAQLRPLAEAVHGGRWWTGAYWRGRGGDVPCRLGELEKRQEELAAAAERLTGEIAERATARAQVDARFQEEIALLRRREGERRQADYEASRTARAREQEALEEQGRTACRGLSEGLAPCDLSIAAVREGRETWRRLLERDEQRAAAAAQWAEAVGTTLATLPERLTVCANVVGAVTSALAADPHFGDRVSARATFDLLVLEEAHLVTESEFLAAARRARRWVLVGEPTDDEPPPPSRRPGPARSLRPSMLRPGFFQRLWRLLHCDPCRLPYAWFHRGGRLVCRLRSAAPDEEKWLTSEHLADQPEIELRFAAPPRSAPRLLEVVFPGTTTIQDAKSFIFRELGELSVQARGGAYRWREDADRWVLDLSDGAEADLVAVDLAEGVRERVGPAASAGDGGACWQTCSLEFDRAAGWSRARAEQWVEEHLQTRDPGRTALLCVPHRSRPALARFLSALLFGGACLPRKADDHAAVEFVPVPSLDDETTRRRSPLPSFPPRVGEGEGGSRRGGTATAAPRLRSSRGGAGLEIDLADPRRLDPLPAELRAALPPAGLVNLFEARAVVRKLEILAADPAFRAGAEEWVGRETRSPGSAATGCHSPSCHASAVPCVGRRPVLAVMALYPAQAALIRLLAAQSTALAAAPVPVQVGTPDDFRQRERFAALVSLTRSHGHRAVPFGGDPALLPTALTRAASRLILFGDAGTLARRCQWQGAVDHLDETAGERERGLLHQLMAYLHGHGPHPSTFGLDESAGV